MCGGISETILRRIPGVISEGEISGQIPGKKNPGGIRIPKGIPAEISEGRFLKKSLEKPMEEFLEQSLEDMRNSWGNP